MGDGTAERNQVTITLSSRAIQEFTLVADWLGTPRNTFIRQVLEGYHQSPSFANLVRRARAGEAPPPPSYHVMEN